MSMTKQEAFELANEIADKYGDRFIQGFQTNNPSGQASRSSVQAPNGHFALFVSNVNGAIQQVTTRDEWTRIEHQYPDPILLREWEAQRHPRVIKQVGQPDPKS